MNPIEYITERQHSWALRNGVPLDAAGWAVSLHDNLFLPLIPEAIQEYQDGAGQELAGSMRAPHSSSALVVNVFHYWKLYNRIGPILNAISPGFPNYQAKDLSFEVQFPIWPTPRGTPPHLDVVIRYRDQAEPEVPKLIAVESKFVEGYGQGQGTFVDAYMAAENSAIWAGLGPLQEVATQIHQGANLYHELKVSQLIKHILGLNAHFRGTRNFELVYLWYPVAGHEAVKHEEEIGRFQQVTDACDPKIKFRAIKYQDLIYSLARDNGEEHGSYVDYLLERYF